MATTEASTEMTPEQKRIKELEEQNNLLQDQVDNPNLELDKLAPNIRKEYHNGAVSYAFLAQKYRCTLEDIRRVMDDRSLHNDSHEYDALIDAV